MAKSKKILLQGDLSVGSAAKLKDELQESVNNASDLLVDLSGAQSVDISIIQLLCAAFKEARKTNKKISLTGVLQPELIEAFYACGFIDTKQLANEGLLSMINENMEAAL